MVTASSKLAVSSASLRRQEEADGADDAEQEERSCHASAASDQPVTGGIIRRPALHTPVPGLRKRGWTVLGGDEAPGNGHSSVTSMEAKM